MGPADFSGYPVDHSASMPKEMLLEQILEEIWDVTRPNKPANPDRLRWLLGMYRGRTGRDRPAFM
jgi:hypothetical protein